MTVGRGFLPDWLVVFWLIDKFAVVPIALVVLFLLLRSLSNSNIGSAARTRYADLVKLA